MTGDYGRQSYQGFLRADCPTIAETLQAAGYTTLTVGKWHVGSAKGQWPLDRGFDRYFGTPSGGGVYFKDTLQIRKNVYFVEDDRRIEAPDDLYVTDTFTDYALRFVDEAAAGEKPFFLYFAHISPHWPLQAKPDEIAKYVGRYDIGWDAVRRGRFARQQEMGIVTKAAELSPRHPQAKPWDETAAEKQRDLSYRMAVYAAQIDAIDRNVGRLIARLKQHNELDNTLFLFLPDNGCSAEGGPGGFSRGKPGAKIGTGLSYASVGLEWANAADTPFRQFKMDMYQGGIATPLIAHWPAGIKRRGEIDRTVGHVIDLLPTCADVAGAPLLTELNGKPAVPVAGVSLAASFDGGEVTRNDWLYWEHQGNRAARNEKWKLVADHNKPWELYEINADPAELRNVAGEHPEVVSQMASRWQAWADENGVLPWPVKKAK